MHCWGGVGRTGTVVGCWLVRHGLDDGDAIARIATLRRELPAGEAVAGDGRPDRARARLEARLVRRLWLLRHAKSSWDDPALADHDRPLAPRGRKAAQADRGAGPPAHDVRPGPRSLLDGGAGTGQRSSSSQRRSMYLAVEIEAGLYHAAADDLLDRLRAVAPEVSRGAR